MDEDATRIARDDIHNRRREIKFHARRRKVTALAEVDEEIRELERPNQERCGAIGHSFKPGATGGMWPGRCIWCGIWDPEDADAALHPDRNTAAQHEDGGDHE